MLSNKNYINSLSTLFDLDGSHAPFLFVFISFYVFLPPLARFKKRPPVMPSVGESENKLYNFTQNQDFDIDNLKKFRAFEVRLQSLTVSNESRYYYIYMGATASLV